LEIAFQREDRALGNELRHPDAACIGKRHWDIGVAQDQALDMRKVLAEIKGQPSHAALKQLQHSLHSAIAPPRQVTGFGEDCIAGQERRRHLGKLTRDPGMVLVQTVNQGDQWSRIDE
jgi:hypothetical protein